MSRERLPHIGFAIAWQQPILRHVNGSHNMDRTSTRLHDAINEAIQIALESEDGIAKLDIEIVREAKKPWHLTPP